MTVNVSEKLRNLHGLLNRNNYSGAANLMNELARNRNFVQEVKKVSGLSSFLGNLHTKAINTRAQRLSNPSYKHPNFAGRPARRLGQFIPLYTESRARPNVNMGNAQAENRRARANAAKVLANKQEEANRRAGERLEAEKAAKALRNRAETEANKARANAVEASKREAAAARAEKTARNAAKAEANKARANAVEASRREAAAARAEKAAKAARNAAAENNASAKAAENALKAKAKANKEAKNTEEERLKTLVGENKQNAENLIRTTKEQLNNINKNNEYTINNATIAKYRNLHARYNKNMSAIYINFRSRLGKNMQSQFPNLHGRAVNLAKTLTNGFNAAQVAVRRNTAGPAKAARDAQAANRGLTGNAKMIKNLENARSKMANHISKGTPANLREARELQRRIRILEKRLSK